MHPSSESPSQSPQTETTFVPQSELPFGCNPVMWPYIAIQNYRIRRFNGLLQLEHKAGELLAQPGSMEQPPNYVRFKAQRLFTSGSTPPHEEKEQE